MTGTWQTLPLSECIQRVATPRKIPKKRFLEAGAFPVVSQERDLVNGYWSDESAVVAVESPLVVFGDHTQVLKYVDFDFVVGADGVKLLQPKAFLRARFLYYFLMANPIKSLGYARHFRLLKELPIRFPKALSVQERIVAILDEAFAAIEIAIANTEKNLANARELFVNGLNGLFAGAGTQWASVHLGDVCHLENGDRGKNYPGRKAFVPAGVPFINAGHLVNGSVDMACMNFIPEERFDLLSNGKIQDGDLLFCLRGSLGKFALVVGLDHGAIASSLIIVRPDKRLDRRFLAAYFETEICSEMIRRYAGGAAQPNLSANNLRLFELPLPSIDDQRRIVANLADLRAQTTHVQDLYETKSHLLADLKLSILYKAFTGELTADPKPTERAISKAGL